MEKIVKLLGLIYFLFIISCDSSDMVDKKALLEKNKDMKSVTADVETTPVNSGKDEDAADDPAIWIHPDDVTKSKIIGTDKTSGLCVYNLNGKQVNYQKVGLVNNVDLRYNYPLDSLKIDIVAASNRTDNSLSVFRFISETYKFEDILENKIFPQVDEVYGLCMYHNKSLNTYYIFINGKDGNIEQYELEPGNNSKIKASLVRTLKVESQPEGMVADDELGFLYVGEENHGIWKFMADPGEGTNKKFIEQSGDSNPNIEFDIEGITIYYAANQKGYLIGSSQGNFSFAVFERGGDNKYLFSFVVMDGNIDGADETDGIDVLNISLGSKFPNGVFVAQDGFNYDGQEIKSQNFKLISWDKIAKAADSKLIIDNDYNIFR